MQACAFGCWMKECSSRAEDSAPRALEEGFAKSLMNGPDNLVSIPRFKHWEITGWYARKSKDWDRLSRRMMPDPQPWGERYQFGLYALRKFQAMK